MCSQYEKDVHGLQQQPVNNAHNTRDWPIQLGELGRRALQAEMLALEKSLHLFIHSFVHLSKPSIHPSSPFGQSVSRNDSQSSSISFSSSSSSSVSCVTDHISVFPFRQQASQASPIVLHSHHGDDGNGHQTTGTAVKISSEAPFVALMYMELLWLFWYRLVWYLFFGDNPLFGDIPKFKFLPCGTYFAFTSFFLDRTVDGQSVSLSWMVFSDLEIQVKFSC